MKLTKKAKQRFAQSVLYFEILSDGYTFYRHNEFLSKEMWSNLFWEAREHAHQFNYKFTYERKLI